MDHTLDQKKEKFISACRILVNEGLTEGAYSLSCRVDPNRIMINANVSPCLITRENILINSLEEQPVEGKAHPAIYRARKDVGAIVHAHPPYAIALGTVEDELVPIHHYGVLFHGRIKVYKSQGQVKTVDRAREIAELLGNGIAILQRGHGTLVVGRDLEEAVLGTIFLEEAARIQFLAKLMGSPEYIPSELSAKITTQIFNEGSKKRTWDHYVAKLKLGRWDIMDA